MKNRLVIIFIGLLLIGCAENTSNKKESQEKQAQEQVNRLKAFAKAYGYVKYFHPSDEASKIDWNRFAVYGANEILNATDSKEVIATLNDLFKPIAPGVVFSNTQQAYDISAITPDTIDDYEPTYWQHKGVSKDMNNQGGVYNSTRVNRYTEIDESSGFGNLSVFLDPEKYRGKEIKYTAWVKLKEGSRGTGHLWLRVDKPGNTFGFFENMDANPIQSNEWKQYEIVGEVDEVASGLMLGSFIKGKGTLFLDDVHLYYKEGNKWVEIPIKNSDFEAEDTIGQRNEQSAWMGSSPGYSYSVSNTESKQGERAAVIGYVGKMKRVEGTALFDSFPAFGELIEKEIGEGIFCQLPLTLYGNTENTYPKSTTLTVLQDRLNEVDESPDNVAVFLGNVINTYNVFQHFYPYFHEVDVDWDKELTTALQRSLLDQTDYDHLVTLQKFTAPLKDGHILVNGTKTKEYVPPIHWEWMEGKLVITRVNEEGLGIQVGDVVTKVNNLSSEEYFEEINSKISAGTEGWLNYRAQHSSLLGEKDEQLVLEINAKNITLNRENKYDYAIDIAIQENDYTVLDDNIYYLNLDKITMDTITALLPQLEQATGIICDLRGYPNGNHDFITHLLKEKDTSKAWMRVPKIMYPDQEKKAGFENHGWELQPKEPYLGDKKVVFIIDGRAISYAESYMSFIEGYQLATIVGQPTAGANGNINPFTLSGNYTISWTGMKVVKHDGSQLHAKGVIPDIYVSKTIEGVKSEKDEFLEKALEVILK